MYAVIIFLILSTMAILFQLALALGAPWGEYAMGGKFPGKLPFKMRIIAIFQAFVILIFAIIVLIRSGIVLNHFYYIGRVAIWIVVGYFVLGSILNLMTTSKGERLIWGPVTIIMLITSFVVAIS